MKTILFLAAAMCLFPQAARLWGDSAGMSNTLAEASSDYVVTAWHIQDGLPSDRVRSVLQSRDGYLWVATFNGLARFDGVHFQRFSDADTPALPNSLANCLFEDSAGRLWIGSDTGEISWRDSAGFHPLAVPESWQSSPIDRFVQSADGTMYAANRDGFLLRVRNGACDGIIGQPPRKAYADIATDTSGRVWAVRYGGALVRLEGQNETPNRSKLRGICPATGTTSVVDTSPFLLGCLVAECSA